jgi:hypothetical protein
MDSSSGGSFTTGRIGAMRFRDSHGTTPHGRQLEVSSYDSWNRDILVDIFPAQGVSVEPEHNLLQVGVARMTQQFKAICRETKDTAIRQFQEDRSPIGPCLDRKRFRFEAMPMPDGIHYTS